MMKMKNFLMLALVTVMGVVLASCEGRDNPVRTSLDVDTSTLNLFVGESAIRTATTKAEDALITYTSSNPAVATVDPIGKVTAVSEGEAIITVEMGESLKSWYAAKTLTYNVVVKKYVPVTGLAINGTDALATSGYSGHLSAAVIPADATDASVTSVTWSSSAPEVLSVDANGNVTFVAVPLAGADVTITATSNADNTIKDTKVISVSPLMGWFVGANGKAYNTKAAANAATTAQAWIAYKSATAGESLAFALTNDAPGGTSWADIPDAPTPKWAGDLNRPAISGGTWRWPTKTDFDNMLAGFQTLPNTGNGVTSDDRPYYWSSTENGANSAWFLYFYGSSSLMLNYNKTYDNSRNYVRAVLAF